MPPLGPRDAYVPVIPDGLSLSGHVVVPSPPPSRRTSRSKETNEAPAGRSNESMNQRPSAPSYPYGQWWIPRVLPPGGSGPPPPAPAWARVPTDYWNLSRSRSASSASQPPRQVNPQPYWGHHRSATWPGAPNPYRHIAYPPPPAGVVPAGGIWHPYVVEPPRQILPVRGRTTFDTIHLVKGDGLTLPAGPPSNFLGMPAPPYIGPVLHPWLVSNPDRREVPVLQWDLRCHPETVKRITARQVTVRLTRNDLKEPATYPAVKEVQIVHQQNMPELLSIFPPIHIRQTSTVTIGDVLRAIYDWFQTPISRYQADQLMRTHPLTWGRVEEAFRKRCVECEHIAIPLVEWRQGVKRVDLLTDQVRFWGMWVTHGDDMTWKIHVGFVVPQLVDRLPRPPPRP
ncbi:hypothetical protein BD414DRAFT_467928 [Trametes punicea]|nr:hypothetical protein BD414DRAFT_467928 [Trametes punicea]